MTTTAFDDQFAPEPVAPVRERYDTAAILRRNIADLEIALRKQVERAEAAEAEAESVRENNHSMMLEIHNLRIVLEQAEAARNYEREWCAQLCEWLPFNTGLEGKTFAEAIRGCGIGGKLAKGFSPFKRIPPPAAPAPVPCLDNIFRILDSVAPKPWNTSAEAHAQGRLILDFKEALLQSVEGENNNG